MPGIFPPSTKTGYKYRPEDYSKLPPLADIPGNLAHGRIANTISNIAHGLYNTVVSGATAPHDVYYNGMTPDEMARRGSDVANTIMLAGAPAALLEGGGGPGMMALEGGKRGAAPAAASAGYREGSPPFPQYATEYPPVGPPVEAIGERGNTYLAKQLTPEAEAFQKARQAIAKDMEKNGYTPYFDVSQRYDVNPANYPMAGDTLTSTLPKRADTVAKYTELANDPAGIANLKAGYEAGAGDPLTHGWYKSGQLEKEFIDRYGPEMGPELFRRRFSQPMAATTGLADPTTNFLMAHYGNYLTDVGEATPPSYAMPYPIGGKYAATNMAQYDRMIREGGGIDAAVNPKRFDFAHAFEGHPTSVVDMQMSRGWNPKFTEPPNYSLFKQALDRTASEMGTDPRNFQEVAWAGLKETPGKPMISHINDAIERSRRLTGQSPQDTLDFITGVRPGPVYMGGPTGALPAAGVAATQPNTPLPVQPPPQPAPGGYLSDLFRRLTGQPTEADRGA